jgi:hypothetical protein
MNLNEKLSLGYPVGIQLGSFHIEDKSVQKWLVKI